MANFSDQPWKKLRLSTHIVPSHYKIFLRPYHDTLLFDGQVTIAICVKQSTDVILVHKKQMVIKDVQVQKATENGTTSEPPILIKEHFDYKKNEFYVIRLTTSISKGKYTVRFEYSGTPDKDAFHEYKYGFFPCKFSVEPDRSERLLFATFLEPNFARKMFPCFDEPCFKAIFTLSVVHPRDYTALFNTEPQEILPYGSTDLLLSTFKPTLPMSTYIVCCILVQLASDIYGVIEIFATERKISLKAYAKATRVRYCQMSLEKCGNFLEYYEKLFDSEYPLSKLDIFDTPYRCTSGALENWGLITCQQEWLTYEPSYETADTWDERLTYLTHEICHQWLGNSVTLKWWNDVWLNESFATFYSYKSMIELFPELKTETSFLTDKWLHSMQMDRYVRRTVIREVTWQPTLGEFDELIIYEKGMLLVRMMEAFMGKEKFAEGIRIYIKRHQYKAVETKDLYDAMKSVAPDLDLTTIMGTWTLQNGFPLITVRRQGPVFTFTQEIFGGKGTKSPFNYRWEVPLIYRTQHDAEPKVEWMHMDEEQVTITIDGITDNDWVKFNADTICYYRVNYDIKEWKRFAKLLQENHEFLSVSDRSGLINDAFHMAYEGKLPYDVLKEVFQYMSKEMEYEPWRMVVPLIMNIADLLKQSPEYKKFKEFIGSVLEPVNIAVAEMCRLSCSQAMRNILLSITDIKRSLSIQFGEPHHERSEEPLYDLHNINSHNFIQAKFNEAIMNSSSEVWYNLWKKAQQESSPKVRKRILEGLAWTSDTLRLTSLLRKVLKAKCLQSEDLVVALKAMAANPDVRSTAWDFYQSHWHELEARYGSDNVDIITIIVPLTSWMSTEEELQELQTFIREHETVCSYSKEYRDLAVAVVQENIEWKKKKSSSLREWLQRQTF